jgi:Tfp pilus assembly protein PilN
MSVRTEAPAPDVEPAVPLAPLTPLAPATPRVNLLPAHIAERARLRRLQAGLAGGLLLTLGVVSLLHLDATASSAEALEELQAAQGRGAALRQEAAGFTEVNGVYATAEAAQALLTQAMGEEVRFSRFLDDLSLSVPDGVWLKEVVFTQADAAVQGTGAGIGTVTFSGVGTEHDDVARWLESLADQSGYADATFSSATTEVVAGRRTVTFSSTVTLTSAALSGRYSASTGG